MIWFWMTAGAMTLGSCLALLLGAVRGRSGTAAPGDADIGVYRDQLSEIERDAARGIIPADEAQRLRTEVARRVLDADRAAQKAQLAAAGPGLTATALMVLAMAAGGTALYWQLGAPGYPDMPLRDRIAQADELRKSRPGQAAAEASTPAPPDAAGVDPEFAALMEKLRATALTHPDDLRGQELLAQNEARLGRFAAAWPAQQSVIRLKGDAATSEDYSRLAELMIFAAGGYISPEAERALTETLRRAPDDGTARYYSGLMLLQTGRPDLAFPLWRKLLETSPADAPWIAPIRQDLPSVAALAGENYELPPPASAALPGPDADAIAAAADMSEADRQQMVRGMVEGLSARLASEGGSADEWARLIAALTVLGEDDRARAIWTEAQERFAGQPDDLATVTAAARQAGLTP